MQVHGQRLAVAGTAVQDGLAQDHETHARHAFQAFATGGHQRVEPRLARVDLQRRKRAHRIDDQALAVLLAQVGDRLAAG
jgi:hypothetical protein